MPFVRRVPTFAIMLRAFFRDLSQSRGRLLVQGPDASRFLHGMVTNDVQRMPLLGGCHACMLTVKGKLLGDMMIYRISEQTFLLCLESCATSVVHAALEKHLIVDNATVENVSDSYQHLGVYGPSAKAFLNQMGFTKDELPTESSFDVRILHHPKNPVYVTPAHDLGIPGYFLMATNDELSSMLERAPDGMLEVLDEESAERYRIEAGIPRFGRDMDEERLPLEAGLGHTIHFQKGCYLGQEVIVRVTSRGHINRKLCGLHFPAGGNPPAIGTSLWHPSKENAGTVMSGTISSRFGTIALGYVHRSLWDIGTVLNVKSGIGDSSQEHIIQAVVCPLPFALP